MISIAQNQLLQRWDTLPSILREALYLEPNSDFLWKTCEAEHLPSEKIQDVARIAGYVLMGFLHPEDMAEELKIQLKLDPKICGLIADAVNGRIFAPLRQEIDKVYEPLSKLGGPKMIQDIGPAPQIVSRAATVPPPVTPLPTMPPPMAAPPPPAPKPKLPDVGWSKMTPEEPVVKLSQTSAPPPAAPPAAPRAPQPAAARPTSPPAQGSMGEFERITMQSKQAPAPPIAPAVPPATKPVAPSEPAPVILHQDASFKPTERAPEFHLQLPSDKFGGEKGPAQPPVRPAVLELGKTPTPAAPKLASTTRVVHYTEYKSPSPEAPVPPAQGTQGPRQVTEITSSTTPSVPPKPPSPPPPPVASPLKSPTPPMSQTPQNKVIYKDYSAAPSPPSSPPAPPPKT